MLVPQQLLKEGVGHHFQLPVPVHPNPAVALAVQAHLLPFLLGTVVDPVVALVSVGDTAVLPDVPLVPATGIAAATPQLVDPDVLRAPVADGHLAVPQGHRFSPVDSDALGLVPDFFGDNGREVPFLIQIGGGIQVQHPVLVQIVVVPGFVVALGAGVGGVFQHPHHAGGAPPHQAHGAFPVPGVELVGNLQRASSLQIEIEDQPHRFGLLLVDLVGVPVPVVAQNIAVAVQHPLLPAHLLARPHPLRGLAALLLGQGGHQGEAKLAIPVHGPDIVLDEVDFHPDAFQIPGDDQGVHHVPGKPADLPGHNQIKLALPGIVDHPQKGGPLFGLGAGNALVYVPALNLPVGMIPRLIVIPLHLVFQGSNLRLMLGRYPAIDGHLPLPIPVQLGVVRQLKAIVVIVPHHNAALLVS